MKSKELSGSKAWVEKFGQSESAYDPLGALSSTGGKACVTCRWFGGYDGEYTCAVVEQYPQEILPSGLSNKFEAIPVPEEPDPLRVIVVGEESIDERSIQANLITNMAKARKPKKDDEDKPKKRRRRSTPYKSLTIGDTKIDAVVDHRATTGFKALQDDEGQWWWVGWVTNNMKDRQGDTFIDAGHRAYVKGRDEGTISPGDVWFWHTPGTSFATAEGCDYITSGKRGFLVEWGKFKSGFETLAEKFVDQKMAMSHTFIGLKTDAQDDEIVRYTIFERGPLPREAAANPYTGFGALKQETQMEFSAEKRAELQERFGEDKVDELEVLAQGFADDAEAAGIEAKALFADVEAKDGDEAEADADKDQDADADPDADPETPEGVDEKTIKAFAEYMDLKGLEGGMRILTDKVKALEEIVPVLAELREAIDGLKQTDDQKVAATLRPKATPVTKKGERWAFVASSAKATATDPEDELVTAKPSDSVHPMTEALRPVLEGATAMNGEDN